MIELGNYYEVGMVDVLISAADNIFVTDMARKQRHPQSENLARLMKMLKHDITDKKFLELIERFLKAGIMENGKYLDSEHGTPQGNGASPVLANIYLHYVLDNWFDVIVKRQCSGECYLIRYADDFVCCFQNEYEARVFREKLEEHFAKYGLELAEEKAKILEFGRFARQNRERRGKGNQIPLTSLASRFIAEWTERNGFPLQSETEQEEDT